jgi:hypothetical protein
MFHEEAEFAHCLKESVLTMALVYFLGSVNTFESSQQIRGCSDIEIVMT